MNIFYRFLIRFIMSLTCILSVYENVVEASSTTSELMFKVLHKKLGINQLTDLENVHNKTQTIAYLSNEALRPNINSNYRDHIVRLGKEYCKEFFKSVISKELHYTDGYRVFYHGQDRTFLLFHDIYKGLYEIINKKQLCDFIMLRIPSKDASTFKTIQQFLKHYINNDKIRNDSFDHLDEVRQRLMCLNPSLFGNTHVSGECTLDYFFESYSIGSINVMGLIKNVFDSFKYKHLFSNYKTELNELSSLLSDAESTKTGALLQIFIPNTLVNELTYRCKPYGKLYYKDKHPEWHLASSDLDDYKKGNSWNPLSLDATQFRLLINETTLNPNNGIKIFRYYNKTTNIKIYEQKLSKLLKRMSKDITQT